MSFAASAVVWRYIFLDGPGYGVLDYVISKFGVTPPDWLASTTWALPALDIIAIWLSLPIATILYLAALQRIPDSVIEASKLDGAGPLRRIRYIVWPGVRYMTPLVAIVALLSFTNGSFDLVNILTKGDPINSTQTLIYYIYFESFAFGAWGYAAALSVLQVVMIAGILVVLRLVSSRGEPMVITTHHSADQDPDRTGHRAGDVRAASVHARGLVDVQLPALDPAATGDPELTSFRQLSGGFLRLDPGDPGTQLCELGRSSPSAPSACSGFCASRAAS